MNNVVFGKTMENIRRRIKIRVVNNKYEFIKYTSRPTCVNWEIIENKLAAIQEKKICLTLKKPIYVALTLLEISKWEMYNFDYNFIFKKFNTKLLFTDTDNLRYEIHGKKIYTKKYTNTKNYLI